MNRPLEGIRVLDLTQAYSGPFCTMNLADHGAEVIKIETPTSGDQTRGWGPMENGFSGYYAYINRNKKGMTLNLKSEEGKQIFTELLKTADVVCENYKVGVLERLGFSVLPSKANFVFAKSDRIPGGELYRKLKENGVLVRWFDKDRIRDYVRITIGSMEQLAELADTLDHLLDEL